MCNACTILFLSTELLIKKRLWRYILINRKNHVNTSTQSPQKTKHTHRKFARENRTDGNGMRENIPTEEQMFLHGLVKSLPKPILFCSDFFSIIFEQFCVDLVGLYLILATTTFQRVVTTAIPGTEGPKQTIRISMSSLCSYHPPHPLSLINLKKNTTACFTTSHLLITIKQ